MNSTQPNPTQRKTVLLRPKTALPKKNSLGEASPDYNTVFNLSKDEEELIGFKKWSQDYYLNPKENKGSFKSSTLGSLNTYPIINPTMKDLRPQITINAYSLFNAIAQSDISDNKTHHKTNSNTEKELRLITKNKSPDSIYRLTTESLLAYKFQNPDKKITIPPRPKTASRVPKQPEFVEFYEEDHEKSWEDTVKTIVQASKEELLKRKNSQPESMTTNTELSTRRMEQIYEKTEPRIGGKRVIMSISKENHHIEPEEPRRMSQTASQPAISAKKDISPMTRFTCIKNGNKFLCAYEPPAIEPKPAIRPFSAYKKRSQSNKELPKQNIKASQGAAFWYSSTLTAPFGQPIRGKKMKDTSDFGVMFRPDFLKTGQVSRLQEKFKEISTASLKRIRFLKAGLHK
ncbi:unnamed protein product [Blepharisma stoltei]|uniref:TPX2 central domain-containing protein n=1 Tax=Blepharisma stoltei TaxID=1481888 RepID=A0AAU9IE05_9CILI|nr:unnamed protein product [Blepharisma stoltei]